VLRILKSNIFESPAQTLVNTVNTVGVMGKGIAKGFKARYPAMYREYKELCDNHALEIGTLHCWRGPSRWVLNFPTKTTWKKPSELEYVEAGLDAFANWYSKMGIRSISFPPLGCGNGQLDWHEVRPLMLKYLWPLDIPIFIHEWFEGSPSPEHYEPAARFAPVSYPEFLSDLHAIVDERKGRFHTFSKGTAFRVKFSESNTLDVFTDRKMQISEEFIANAWVGLKVGFLTSETLGVGEVDRYARYLLPVVAALPYVRRVPVQSSSNPRQTAFGLFFNEAASGYDTHKLGARQDSQQWLFH